QTQTQREATAGVTRAPASPPASPSPQGLSLKDRMEAAWLEQRGRAYAWRIPADDTAMRSVLVDAGNDEAEVLRRWGIALRASFPLCRGVVDLKREWNAYATDAPARPQPQRKGPTRAQDVKWDEQQEGSDGPF